MGQSNLSRHRTAIILTALITLCAFFTFVRGYDEPAKFFWDENYHITSAQKYLSGTFFMEPHPPLGKLFIALGEYLIDANPDDSQFIGVDHAKDVPEGFSFKGYRLFPVIFAWLTAPVFFLLLYSLTGAAWRSAIISLAYVFENAIIVHSRGAMLEGVQLFFIVATLLGLTLLTSHVRSGARVGFLPLLVGIFFSLACATKVTSLVIAIAFIPLLLELLKGAFKKPPFGMFFRRWRATSSNEANAINGVPGPEGSVLSPIASSQSDDAIGDPLHQRRNVIYTVIQGCLGFVIVQLVVWQIHFSLGKTVVPTLPDNGFYAASPEYKEILSKGEQSQPGWFPTMLRDSYEFFVRYEKGVPDLNICKPDETGSYPLMWPFGGRSISYRWDAAQDSIRPLHLQVNPVTWAFGLVGIVCALALLLGRALFGVTRAEGESPWLMTYLALWLAYMAVMLQISRAMYLYHYFIPHLFALVLLALVWPKLQLTAPSIRKKVRREIASAIVVIVAVSAYLWYSPLTYARPMPRQSGYSSRALLSVWDLHCPGCPLTNAMARPLTKDGPIPLSNLTLQGITAIAAWQEWGKPQVGSAVEGEPIVIGGITHKTGFGVHARSSLVFPINKRFTQFSGKAGLPDYLKTKEGDRPSLIFVILVDSEPVWRSAVMTVNNPSADFSVPVVGGRMLELRVEEGGDSINNDHAAWVDLVLR